MLAENATNLVDRVTVVCKPSPFAGVVRAADGASTVLRLQNQVALFQRDAIEFVEVCTLLDEFIFLRVFRAVSLMPLTDQILIFLIVVPRPSRMFGSVFIVFVLAHS